MDNGIDFKDDTDNPIEKIYCPRNQGRVSADAFHPLNNPVRTQIQ